MSLSTDPTKLKTLTGYKLFEFTIYHNPGTPTEREEKHWVYASDADAASGYADSYVRTVTERRKFAGYNDKTHLWTTPFGTLIATRAQETSLLDMQIPVAGSTDKVALEQVALAERPSLFEALHVGLSLLETFSSDACDDWTVGRIKAEQFDLHNSEFREMYVRLDEATAPPTVRAAIQLLSTVEGA